MRLRNRLLPLISLRNTLKLGEVKTRADGYHFIVVIQTGHASFGIIVDRVFDTEEIVVKPVFPILRDIESFSGNTILGDGSVVMILDLNGIVANAQAMDSESHAEQKTKVSSAKRGGGSQALLLFRAGAGAPKAVPLALIARLEQLDRKTIEFSDQKPMVQYRGKLMPLAPVVANGAMAKEGLQPVLVFTDQNKNMGLIVDEIVDIVDDQVHVDLSSGRPGYLGTSIISGKATDIIDAAWFLEQAFQDWFGTQADTKLTGKKSCRVLLVDDSTFFRNLLTPLLTVAGYDVTAVEDAEDALTLQDTGENFDIIVGDIEMPGTNGFDFAAKIRNGGRWSAVPIVALSAHATPHDFDRGRQAGFTDYVAKFDREGLLASLQQNLGGHA